MADTLQSLIAEALRIRGQQAPKPRKAASLAFSTGGTSERLPANVERLVTHSRKHGVETWLRSATKPGGEMTGGEVLKAYKRSLGADKGMTGAETRAILANLYGEAAIVSRTSGYVIRGVQLKAAAPGQAKAATA